jgi:hypothetical protein
MIGRNDLKFVRWFSTTVDAVELGYSRFSPLASQRKTRRTCSSACKLPDFAQSGQMVVFGHAAFLLAKLTANSAVPHISAAGC